VPAPTLNSDRRHKPLTDLSEKYENLANLERSFTSGLIFVSFERFVSPLCEKEQSDASESVESNKFPA
jgi:hypothetical protein